MLNSNPPMTGPPHFVDLHVNPGESVSIQLFDGNETVLRGPATITMISQHTFPPIPMPVQVPPGHMIQQIVDENGTLRHIILSALNNNGSTPSSTGLMPQQQQQQQPPFPYCCCCCYSCTGAQPTPPLPPPPPPPPPPQVHHNILAFPTQNNRRRLPARAYSPGGKRASPAFYNNNTLGKLPVKNKIPSTASASVDGVAKVTYPNSKFGTSSDNKSYELSENNITLDQKSNHTDNNCLDQDINVNVVNVCKESLQDITNGINNISGTHPGLNSGLNSNNTHLGLNSGVNSGLNSGLNSNNTHLGVNSNQSFAFTNHEDKNILTITNDIVHCKETDCSLLTKHQDNDLNGCFNKQQTNNSPNDDKQSDYDLANILDCQQSKNHDEIYKIDTCLDDYDIKVNHRLSHSESRIITESSENDLVDLIDRVNDDTFIDYSNESKCNNNTHLQSNTSISDVKVEEIEQIDIKESNLDHDNQQYKQLNEEKVERVEKIERIEKIEKIDKIESQQSINNNNYNSEQENHENHMNIVEESEKVDLEKNNQLNDDTVVDDTNENVNESVNDNENEKKFDDDHDNDEDDDYDEDDVNEDKSEQNDLVESVKSLKLSPQRSPKHLLPQLQLLNLTYISLTANTVKLKWQYQQPHSSSDQLYTKHYVVEMILNKFSNDTNLNDKSLACSRIVYQGHSNNCRISHLTSQQQYSFRVRTTSDEHLVVSNILTITTPEQPALTLKYKNHNKKNKQHLLQQQQQHQQITNQHMSKQHNTLDQQQNTDTDEIGINTDQRCAIGILLLFSTFALIIAGLIQHLYYNINID